jgi:hypothetical protein
MLRGAFAVWFVCIGLVQALAQDPEIRSGSRIIDDTTRQVYGPTTTQVFLEETIFNNQWISSPIDTVIRNFHRWPYLQRYSNLYQDLGNVGTAARPVYEPVPSAIGVTSGFNAYNLYWDAGSVKHYNTRSPYSNMKIIVGGKGRALTNVTYTRNINPRWNFGFDYNGIFIDKQVQRQGKGDRNVKSNYYDIFMSYSSKDSSYTALGSFRRMYHRVAEYGGVKTAEDYSYSDLFQDNAQPWLTQAESNDLRRNYHLYHQYKVGSALQVYHRFDSDRQRNKFNDNYASEVNKDYFDPVLLVDSAQTRDETNFNTIRNELGIKGNLLKLFYNGYVTVRNYDMIYKYFNDEVNYSPTRGDEFYVGGRMALKLDSLVEVRGLLETMLDDRYRLEGSITTKWFTAYLRRSVASPSFLQQAYRGNHDEWVNNFGTVESSEAGGSIIYRSQWLDLHPGLRLSTFRNYVYFRKGDFDSDQTVLPVQTSGYQTMASPEIFMAVKPLKNTRLSGRAIYTRMLENADNAMQVPELFVNAQLAYANIWVHGNFDFQVGADVHWRSAYFAYGYDPVIQQFYTQREVIAPEFPIVDVFLNAKIIRGRIFLKYNNVIKLFSKYGNVPTPFYPGVVNVFDFGFDWVFFD